MRGISILLAVAGCDQLFKLSEVPFDGRTRPCSIERFDATNTELAVSWDREAEAGCSVGVDAGELLVMLPPNVGCEADLNSNTAFSFVGGRATLKVIDVVPDGSAETYFALRRDETNMYLFNYNRTGLDFRVRVNSDDFQLAEISYDRSAHVYWAFEHRAEPPGMMFSTSANGVEFTLRHTVDLMVPLDEVKLELGAGAFGSGLPAQGTSRFDDVELCVP